MLMKWLTIGMMVFLVIGLAKGARMRPGPEEREHIIYRDRDPW